jgi:hypothetical protein
MTTALLNISSRLYLLIKFVISPPHSPAGAVARSDLVRHVMQQVSGLVATRTMPIVGARHFWRHGCFDVFIHPERVLIGHDQFKAIEAIGFLL